MVFLAYLFNAILRNYYWSHQLKLAEIILIPKPGKDPKEVKSYALSYYYQSSQNY